MPIYIYTLFCVVFSFHSPLTHTHNIFVKLWCLREQIILCWNVLEWCWCIFSSSSINMLMMNGSAFWQQILNDIVFRALSLFFRSAKKTIIKRQFQCSCCLPWTTDICPDRRAALLDLVHSFLRLPIPFFTALFVRKDYSTKNERRNTCE